MATFVLVPGSWCGGWIWRDVLPPLRAPGHDVYPLTLTGVGERIHLGHPNVDLDLHIEDVVNVLTFEELSSVFMVGWSYGGMVIAGVADRLPQRVAHLVYLEAAEPADGQSVHDIAGPETKAEEEELARMHGEGWRIPPPQEAAFADPQDRGLYIADETVRRWCVSKFTTQPIKTMSQAVRRTNPDAADIPFTYLVGTLGRSAESLARKRAQAEGRAGGRYVEIPVNHMALVSAPAEVARALIEIGQTT